MKRRSSSLSDTLANTDNNATNTTANTTDNDISNKKHKVKKDGMVKFTTYYYEFRKLLFLFSEYYKSIKICCSKTNIKINMVNMIDMTDMTDMIDMMDRKPNIREESKRCIDMFVFFEDKIGRAHV